MLSSTIENRDMLLVIKCFSILRHSNLLDYIEDEKSIDPKSELYLFEEKKYIAENPPNFNEESIALLGKN